MMFAQPLCTPLRPGLHRDVRVRTLGLGLVLWDNDREAELTLSVVNEALHRLLVAVADLARGGRLCLRADRVTAVPHRGTTVPG
jgi:hypothetical protein